MPSVAKLGAADVDAVLGVVREAAAGDGEQPFERALVDRLGKAVPSDQAGYFEYCFTADCAPATTVNLYVVKQPGPEVDWRSEEVGSALPSWPLHDSLGARTTAARRFSDGVSRTEKLRNPWYATVMRPDVEHEMKVWLPSPAGIVRGFFFVREPGRCDFGERDRAVLTVLRSHLGAIRERWERRRRPPGLTEREVEVLRLVRAGLTNREIADRLVVSAGTVRTHLENVFEKLDVHTRTAAVARAFGATA